MTFRVFVQDVGESGFSGVDDINAPDSLKAIMKFAYPPGGLTWYGKKLIALPHDRKDLWPDGQTGHVPEEALSFR
jgi:hypothetical protein